VVVYFHTWELDPRQPRLRAGWRSRFRHYTALHRTERRLDEILAKGGFVPIVKLLEQVETTGYLRPGRHLIRDQISSSPTRDWSKGASELVGA
jgi:hypothetical protein